MVAPNIPLRAGPSGPPVDLAALLQAAPGLISVRRAWGLAGLGAGYVPPDSLPPGVTLLSATIPWAAAEVALADRLAYLVIEHMQMRSLAQPVGYPSGCAMHLLWTPAGGASSAIHTVDLRAVPLAYGADFTFWGQAHTSYLVPAVGYGPSFVLGNNAIALSASNPAPTEPYEAVGVRLVVVELCGDATQFDLDQSVTMPGPPAPPPPP